MQWVLDYKGGNWHEKVINAWELHLCSPQTCRAHTLRDSVHMSRLCSCQDCAHVRTVHTLRDSVHRSRLCSCQEVLLIHYVTLCTGQDYAHVKTVLIHYVICAQVKQDFPLCLLLKPPPPPCPVLNQAMGVHNRIFWLVIHALIFPYIVFLKVVDGPICLLVLHTC